MPTLDIVLEVPNSISTGLTNGSLERIGGVIREAQNKQIVAWLRDGSITTDTTKSVAQSLLSMTERGRMLTVMSGSALLLNLALAGIQQEQIIGRLNELNQQINALKAEFDHDRYVRFQSALKDARDIFNTDDIDFAQQALRSAVKGLYEAQEHFLRDFEDSLSATTPNPTTAQHLLSQALYAATIRTRCYLRVEQRDLAIQYLAEDIQVFKEHTHRLMQSLLGDHPAVFLHSAFSNEIAERSFDLQLWLRGESATPLNIMNLIHELRKDFWNDAVTSRLDQPGHLVQQVIRRAQRSDQQNVEPLQEALTHAELAQENFERLQGFELELRSMRLSTFSEWDRLASDETQQNDYLIVDTERLQRLQVE